MIPQDKPELKRGNRRVNELDVPVSNKGGTQAEKMFVESS
jgi:hypothetical protein